MARVSPCGPVAFVEEASPVRPLVLTYNSMLRTDFEKMEPEYSLSTYKIGFCPAIIFLFLNILHCTQVSPRTVEQNCRLLAEH